MPVFSRQHEPRRGDELIANIGLIHATPNVELTKEQQATSLPAVTMTSIEHDRNR
jgi:hypothetical protein